MKTGMMKRKMIKKEYQCDNECDYKPKQVKVKVSESKELKLTRYTNGEDSFNYLEKGGKIYEISSRDGTVRIMSIETYDKLVTFYHHNDLSEYNKETVKYEKVKDDKETDEYYVMNTPFHLLK